MFYKLKNSPNFNKEETYWKPTNSKHFLSLFQITVCEYRWQTAVNKNTVEKIYNNNVNFFY